LVSVVFLLDFKTIPTVRNGRLNQILKRQTSRFHYGSKVPAVTITVLTINTRMHDRSPFRLATRTLIKSGGGILDLWALSST
jgi:hypothetical protein